MQPTGVFVGAATLDLHYLVPEDRTRDSKGPALRFGSYAGGPAANAAVTFAHLGGTARLCAEIGEHPLGGIIAAELAARGVELVDLAAGSEALPMVSSVLSFEGSGDRMAVSSHYADSGVAESLPGPLPAGTSVLLVDGFLRMPCLDAASRAAAQGITVVLDGGSWKPGMRELLPLVDIAVCSADFHPPETATHDETLDYLQQQGIRRAAVTRGREPILYRDGTGTGEVAVEDVRVVDTLGAGDVLHGAFCRFLAGGLPFAEALTEAAQVATTSCRSFGTRAWIDSRT
jgi:sugar/nucleoside kinase (ribokinase family)